MMSNAFAETATATSKVRCWATLELGNNISLIILSHHELSVQRGRQQVVEVGTLGNSRSSSLRSNECNRLPVHGTLAMYAFL